MAGGGVGRDGGGTHLHDLPEVILLNVFVMVEDTRSRNAMSLVCRRWYSLERSTRNSITLRGNVRDLILVPTCFRSVTHLDISLLSPWGYSFLHHQNPQHPPQQVQQHGPGHDWLEEQEDQDDYPNQLIAHRLRQAFPSVTSLTVYARTPSTLRALAPHWPGLRHAKLVRWHQRSHSPLGSDFAGLLHSCPSLSSLDLSHFYCWTEDLPPALQASPSAAASLTRLDLLSLSGGGFKSHELLAISTACRNLRHLLVTCLFDPRYIDFVGDSALLSLASNCPQLSLLHLVDSSALSAARADPEDEGFTPEDARISHRALEELFTRLPLLEDLALDVCQNVRDAGPALEALNYKCPRIKSLKLGQFHGICKAAGLHLDGIAVCGGLKSLSIKNSADLTDSGLVAIARGCSRLAKFEIHGCKRVTEVGMRRLTSIRRSTLVDVRISCCKHLDAARSLWAIEPIRDCIELLHIDCIWTTVGLEQLPESLGGDELIVDIDDFEQEPTEETSCLPGFIDFLTSDDAGVNLKKKKKCRFAGGLVNGCSNNHLDTGGGFWCRTWKRLRHLSLWIPVGELLTPLADAGLYSCPELEEICIKIEGDCRACPKPTQRAFGLSSLACYPLLSKMKLDCGDAIGYVLTAPMGQMDLSLWERFYVHGIGDLNLHELDYWPPQDKDVNQRSLSLPAAGLLAECATLRKLFIHGTTHEHFMMFLLRIPNLRDVQLREDYYPAPENDTSTEMRVDSCSRFEDALNRRLIPD